MNAARRHGDQSHQALYGHGFSAAGFTDDGESLPPLHAKTDASHSLNDTAVGLEVHVQIVDLK